MEELGCLGLVVTGEHGGIDLRGQGWKLWEGWKTGSPGAALFSSPFLLHRKIKTWSMETCALKTSSWPARASTVSVAHSSSSVTPASPSLCCPGKVSLLTPPPTKRKGAGAGFGVLSPFRKYTQAKWVSGAPAVPSGLGEDKEWKEGWSLLSLRS